MKVCPECELPYATTHWELKVQWYAYQHHLKVCPKTEEMGNL